MKAELLTILKNTDEPVTAAQIAYKLRLPGKRETQRRHVRDLVKQLREDGVWIVAVGVAGYFFTEDESLWRDYLEGRAIDGKKTIGLASKITKIVNNRGQFLMFQQKEFAGSACKNI